MDGQIIEVELPDGDGHMYVELEVPPGGDVGFGSMTKRPWRELSEQVAKTSRWVVAAVKEGLPEQPDRLGVEFGIKLTTQTGELLGVLAKAGAEASVLVRLEWDKKTEA